MPPAEVWAAPRRGSEGLIPLLASLMVVWHAVPGVVFVVSAAGKLRHPQGFADSLRPLRVVPIRLVRPVAVLLTGAEVMTAVALCWGIVAILAGGPVRQPAGAAGLVLAGVLLVVLTTGIAIEVRRGTEATCACFGLSQRRLGRPHLIRNGLLLACVAAGLVSYLTTAGTASTAGALVALAAGVVLALILIRLDDLVELFTPMPAAAGPASRTRS